MTIFKGAATALVTPFKDNAIDFNAYDRLLEMQLASGIDGLVVCGTTGEASTLTEEEKLQLAAHTIKKANKKVPIIIGTGSNNTMQALDMSKKMEALGADGLLLVTPYYNKCSDRGLIEHYNLIADSVSIPCILYSVPSRTGVNISPHVVSQLCKHPNIVGIKDASGNISQLVEIAKYISDDFALYSGNDDNVVPILSLGGTGVISTVSNIIPKDMHDMVIKYLEGNVEEARKLQLKAKSLIDVVFSDVNPIPIKAALNMLGYIEREYRLPLCRPSNQVLFNLSEELKSYGFTLK